MAKKTNYYKIKLAGHKEPAIVKAFTRNQAVLHIARLTITATLAEPGDMIGVTAASIIDATIEPEPKAAPAATAASGEPVTDTYLQGIADRGVAAVAATAPAAAEPAPEAAVAPLAAVAPQADPAIAAEPEAVAQPQDGSGNADTDTIALATEAAAAAAPADEDPADAAVANEPPAPQAPLQADPAPVGKPLDGGVVAAVGLPSWMK